MVVVVGREAEAPISRRTRIRKPGWPRVRFSEKAHGAQSSLDTNH